MTTRKNIVRGFTLVEALVAIGAIAIISVGLASIFGSVGETVTRGRRVAAINEMAKRIEEQIRSDIDRMTRDGFLVIRNSVATPPGRVIGNRADQAYLSPSDPFPRPYRSVNGGNIPVADRDHRNRRVDELLFFAKGDFASARQPLHPDLIARANSARIAYTHGYSIAPEPEFPQSWRDRYISPQLNDAFVDDNRTQAPRLAFASRETTGNASQRQGVGFNGPNEFASEWTLLRHVTLLAEPKRSEPQRSGGGAVQLPGRSVGQSYDSRYQIGGQPAAATIFQSLTNYYPSQTVAGAFFSAGMPPTGTVIREPFLLPSTGSQMSRAGLVFSSGLLDIATTSLGEIRRIVLGATDTFANPYPTPQNTFNAFNPGDLDLFMQQTLVPSFVPEQASGGPPGRETLGNMGTVDLMQRWMVDAFPGNQLGMDALSPVSMFEFSTRMRYEPDPPDLSTPLAIPQTTGNQTDTSIQIADQMMLSSSTFLPRCTEFIVEWSFGETVPGPASSNNPSVGDLVWHGLWRESDWNGDGQIDPGAEYEALPYPWRWDPTSPRPISLPRVPHAFSYTRSDGTTGTKVVPQALVHPEWRTDPNGGDLGIQLTSCFGYIDPTYVPMTDNDPASIDWAWPKLIRITVSIADEEDPNLERTFQFVFEVPDDRAG